MKTILITGATAGFGLATAKELAKDGHRLILVGRRAEKLQELHDELPVPVHTAVLDVTQRQAVHEFFTDLPAEFRKIDVLVNNAGLARGMEPAQDASLDNWDEMVQTNILGMLYMAHGTLGLMKQQGTGLIINLGSVAAHVPYYGGNVYGATKAFVGQFSKGLRVDLFGTGIKVSNIEPGAAATEFAGVRFKDKAKGDAFYAGWKPLAAEDVAQTIAWVIEQPDHVNIDNIEIMALAQTQAGMQINK